MASTECAMKEKIIVTLTTIDSLHLRLLGVHPASTNTSAIITFIHLFSHSSQTFSMYSSVRFFFSSFFAQRPFFRFAIECDDCDFFRTKRNKNFCSSVFFLHFYFLNKHINSIRIQCTSSTVIQILLRYFAAVRHAAAHINNQKTWYPQCVYL